VKSESVAVGRSVDVCCYVLPGGWTSETVTEAVGVVRAGEAISGALRSALLNNKDLL
jgi:hypothetical protein